MVDVDKAVVIRLKKAGMKFEVLADPDKALEFRKGRSLNVEEILAYPGVYHDVRRGDAIPENELQGNFGTTNVFQVAKKVIVEGELQFTTEQRRRFVEEKRREIADIISKRGINPQTNTVKTLLPIKFQRIIVQIIIPPQFSGKLYSVLKRTVGKFDERWLNDGSLQVTLDIPAGAQEEVFKKIGDITKGNFKSNIIKRVDV